jgi:hypothetical protein
MCFASVSRASKRFVGKQSRKKYKNYLDTHFWVFQDRTLQFSAGFFFIDGIIIENKCTRLLFLCHNYCKALGTAASFYGNPGTKNYF